MNFPQYWARGEYDGFLTWRWSSQSLAEAQSLADDAARNIAERFRAGDYPKNSGHYYPNRPFREQVLQEIKDATGEICAVITRNAYGCQVLNTARVMFVDIDFPEPKPVRGFLRKLFAKPAPPPSSDAQNAALLGIENWTRNHSSWGWRIYRTRAGLRLLATHTLIAADSPDTKEVFSALRADPLYQKLCLSQKCFRARLTPKPWRCGLHKKPERWPWLDSKREQRFQKWQTQYATCAANWATCEFLRHLGNPDIHPEVQSILKFHDGPTQAASKLQLA